MPPSVPKKAQIIIRFLGAYLLFATKIGALESEESDDGESDDQSEYFSDFEHPSERGQWRGCVVGCVLCLKLGVPCIWLGFFGKPALIPLS